MFVGEGYVAMSSIFFKVNFDHMDIEHVVADSSKKNIWKPRGWTVASKDI